MKILRSRSDPNSSDFLDLVKCLTTPHVEHRVCAARSLEKFGSRAVPPLCRALKDADLEVVAAAAESLGRIGDASAVHPLAVALRRAVITRIPWLQVVAGFGLMGLAIAAEMLVLIPLVALATVVIGAFIVFLSEAFIFADFLGGVLSEICNSLVMRVGAAGATLRIRRRRNQYCLQIVEALLRIAERSPTPTLRETLPDLESVAADFVQQDEQTRRRAKAVKIRIASLTKRLQNLPAPASAPAPEVRGLPRATGRTPRTQDLPRAVVPRQNERQ